MVISVVNGPNKQARKRTRVTIDQKGKITMGNLSRRCLTETIAGDDVPGERELFPHASLMGLASGKPTPEDLLEKYAWKTVAQKRRIERHRKVERLRPAGDPQRSSVGTVLRGCSKLGETS